MNHSSRKGVRDGELIKANRKRDTGGWVVTGLNETDEE